MDNLVNNNPMILNILDIKGPGTDIDDLISKIHSRNKYDSAGVFTLSFDNSRYNLDFNGTVPMPDELKASTYGYPMSDEDHDQQSDNFIKFKACNSYAWALENWGTMFPASHCSSVDTIIDRYIVPDSKHVRIHFQTFLSVPNKWVYNTLLKYPNLMFDIYSTSPIFHLNEGDCIKSTYFYSGGVPINYQGAIDKELTGAYR